ncbi:MAG: hypothetical protein Tsb009_27130 [Planctomycetaceae bacterium]
MTPLFDATLNIEPVGDASTKTAEQLAATSMRQLSRQSGLRMVCLERETSRILDKSHSLLPDQLDSTIRECLASAATLKTDALKILESPTGDFIFEIPLHCDPASAHVESRFAAVGVVHSTTSPRRKQSTTEEEIPDIWFTPDMVCSHSVLTSLLESVIEHLRLKDQAEANKQLIAQSDEHLAYSFEEISLLHDLARNLQISRGISELVEMCLERIEELTEAEGCAIWIHERNHSPQFYRQGAVNLDELEFAHLIAHHDQEDWSVPLVRNHLGESELVELFPGLRNMVMAPISEGSNRYGWVFICNRHQEKEFGTVQASLLNSIATFLGTHLRNTDLYRQHQELLLSFVGSLVSSLDAKDPYTRGHSQRVALVGRRIAEEMGLSEQDVENIYLSGLLHDIGKIGIDDRTLRKPDKLTEEEITAIQKHPMIGYEILKGLTNLQAILPGVRNHHESYDGTGYPDRLAEHEIPLMARILAVADSYDAMTSDRPYRKGLPLEKVEAILRNGSGRQWDPDVIEAYFKVRDDVRTICKEFSPTIS